MKKEGKAHRAKKISIALIASKFNHKQFISNVKHKYLDWDCSRKLQNKRKLAFSPAIKIKWMKIVYLVYLLVSSLVYFLLKVGSTLGTRLKWSPFLE